jgi:acyl-CoA thioesterase I
MSTVPAADVTVSRRSRILTQGSVAATASCEAAGDRMIEDGTIEDGAAEGGAISFMGIGYGARSRLRKAAHAWRCRLLTVLLTLVLPAASALMAVLPANAQPANPQPSSGQAASVQPGVTHGSVPPRLLILGDSLTAGYGLAAPEGFQPQLAAALKAKNVPVVLVDAAVSGDTSAGGRARLDWALADGADAAFVELGANDGLRGVDPKDMDANLTAILDALAAKHIPTLLTGMYAPPNMGEDYSREFRAVFDRLGARPGLLYDPFFLQGIAADPTLNQADGIHPNAEGVQKNVTRLLPLIERLLAEARGS